MFTGIIQDIGYVTRIDKKGDWTLTIETKLPLHDVPSGGSIACNGICLTVIAKEDKTFRTQMSAETIHLTTAKNWAVGQAINLERALRVGDELGGHYVSGHVDGVTKVTDRRRDMDSERFRLALPSAFAGFIAAKGSITLDGVALTVNDVGSEDFGVNIIPHTLIATTFHGLQIGSQVNFEIDMIARYVARLAKR